MAQSQFLHWYSTLEEFFGLGILLMMSHILISFLAARILRFQWLTTSLIGLLAVALLYFDLPMVSSEWRVQHPYQVYLFGWLLCLTILVGLRAGSFLRHLLGLGSGLLRSFFSVSLIVSLVLITSLYLSPQSLEKLLPGWQGSLGLLMLCIALIALCFATVRLLRAGVLIVAWLGICTILGTEVFLNKLPHQVLSEDFQSVPDFLPESEISQLIDSLEKSENQRPSDVLVLGGDKGGQIVEFLQALFRRAQVEASVVQLGDSANSSFELFQIAKTAVQKFKPKIIIFGNWLADQEIARAIPGHGNLSDLEVEHLSQRRKKIAKLPFVQNVYESRLYQYFFAGTAAPKADSVPVRVSPAEFQEVLAGLQGLAEEKATDLLLFVQPRNSDSKRAQLYETSLEKFRGQPHIHIARLDHFQLRSNYDLLFASGDHLNSHGKLLLARELHGSLQMIDSQRFGNPELPVDRTWTVASKKLSDDLLFQIEPQDQNSGYYRVVLSVNGQFVDQKRFVGSEPTTARFKVPQHFLKAPFLELGLFAYREQSRQGAGQENEAYQLPRSVYLAADQRSGIWIREPELIFKNLDSSKAIKIAVFERGTGDLMSAESFDATEAQIENLTRQVRRLDWGTPVLISVAPLEPDMLARISSATNYLSVDLTDYARSSVAAFGLAGVKQARAEIFRAEQVPATVGIQSHMPFKVSSNFLG